MNLNICKELATAMEKQGFSETSIRKFKESEQYITTFNDTPEVQKTMLTMYFYNLLMYRPEPIPTNIRIGLNAANSAQAWLEDMITVVLPFIRVNEDKFYG